jgi:histidinol-phosphatase (PHP family)
MIDSHTHTKYSKHAKGSVEDIVVAAISNNIKILTITDHAPYPVDSNNRLLESELVSYFSDIKKASEKYASEILILTGLEVDFHPDELDYIQGLLKQISVDYVIGAIHYVYVDGERINVWDIDKLDDQQFILEYFKYLDGLIDSELFDSIAHPDTILRGGMENVVYQQFFSTLIPKMIKHGLSYELNCSAMRKSVFNSLTKTKSKGLCLYPSKDVTNEFNIQGGSFTIGSDAHQPLDVGAGIKEQILMCKENNIEFISYYKQRKKINVSTSEILAFYNQVK